MKANIKNHMKKSFNQEGTALQYMTNVLFSLCQFKMFKSIPIRSKYTKKYLLKDKNKSSKFLNSLLYLKLIGGSCPPSTYPCHYSMCKACLYV